MGQYTDPVMACSKDILLAWLSLSEMSQKYQIRNRQNGNKKQQGVRFASPSEEHLYKLKLGWSQTTPLLLHKLLNSDGITICTHEIRITNCVAIFAICQNPKVLSASNIVLLY